jgi:hypothetical protein
MCSASHQIDFVHLRDGCVGGVEVLQKAKKRFQFDVFGNGDLSVGTPFHFHSQMITSRGDDAFMPKDHCAIGSELNVAENLFVQKNFFRSFSILVVQISPNGRV